MCDILIIVFLVLLNGFFSLTEAAFISSRKSLLTTYANKGNKNAVFLLSMLDNPEKFLSSIQICITLIGIVSGAFGGIAIADDLSILIATLNISAAIAYDISLVIVIASITYFSILIGELIPKTVALKKPEKYALLFSPVIKIVMILFKPIVHLLSFSARLIISLTRLHNDDQKTDPVREIVSLIRLASINNEIEKDQERIILNTINITKISLKDIMIEKTSIRYLNSSLSIMEAFLQAHIHHHTRYLLVESDNLDNVLGYVNFKDIVNVLKINPIDASLHGICRPILAFTYSDKPLDVLRKMIKNNQHISIVQNKKYQTIGLVTLEDIIEFILGDIFDEYDLLPDYFYKIADNLYVVGGGITLKKIEKQLGLSFPDNSMTLTTWLISVLGNNIAVGHKYEFDNCIYSVKKMKLKQVNEVLIEIKQ